MLQSKSNRTQQFSLYTAQQSQPSSRNVTVKGSELPPTAQVIITKARRLCHHRAWKQWRKPQKEASAQPPQPGQKEEEECWKQYKDAINSSCHSITRSQRTWAMLKDTPLFILAKGQAPLYSILLLELLAEAASLWRASTAMALPWQSSTTAFLWWCFHNSDPGGYYDAGTMHASRHWFYHGESNAYARSNGVYSFWLCWV